MAAVLGTGVESLAAAAILLCSSVLSAGGKRAFLGVEAVFISAAVSADHLTSSDITATSMVGIIAVRAQVQTGALTKLSSDDAPAKEKSSWKYQL